MKKITELFLIVLVFLIPIGLITAIVSWYGFWAYVIIHFIRKFW